MKIEEILARFRNYVKTNGTWEVDEEGDWISDGRGTRVILWGRRMRPSTIRSIVRRGKVSIRKGDTWMVESPSFFIFLAEKIEEEPSSGLPSPSELRERAVLYDLSRQIRMGSKDEVAVYLEDFLTREAGIKFRELQSAEEQPEDAAG